MNYPEAIFLFSFPSLLTSSNDHSMTQEWDLIRYFLCGSDRFILILLHLSLHSPLRIMLLLAARGEKNQRTGIECMISALLAACTDTYKCQTICLQTVSTLSTLCMWPYQDTFLWKSNYVMATTDIIHKSIWNKERR